MALRVYGQPKSDPVWEFMDMFKMEIIGLQRKKHPIFQVRNKIMNLIVQNQIVVIIGETGSGKTTQLPQYLVEAGLNNGRIGCTQPRRIAAASVARRVCEEFPCELGLAVGYTIRFEDCVGPQTVIKYMTDGTLLHECLRDPLLTAYSVIMIDEAHERTVNTDILFGLLKDTVKRRKDLRLIISSATLETEKFSEYFNNAPVFNISGKLFPVDIVHVPMHNGLNYEKAAEQKVLEIHRKELPGDILVFLTGQEDIEKLCFSLEERIRELGSSTRKLVILPLYSALDTEEQKRVFDPPPPGARKVVIATNIAESSLTIDGIVYVIDSGFIKQKTYKPRSGMEFLECSLISQQQAKQRAGRAGRTAPGKCFRLYSADTFHLQMPASFIPEIQRTNLDSVVLKLKVMGIDDVKNFDFMDKPPSDALDAAIDKLQMIEALNANESVTSLGRKISVFPMDPPLAKFLILSADMGCSDEVLTIVSMLSVQNIHRLFRRPKSKRNMADMKHTRFHKPEGDFLTLLEVYNQWKVNRYSEDWCYVNFLCADVLRLAQEIRKQLTNYFDNQKLAFISCYDDPLPIQKAICAAFFYNAAYRAICPGLVSPMHGYRVLRNDREVTTNQAFIRPGSSLFADRPQWVVFYELIKTTKTYMRQVTKIESSWLPKFAPNFFQLSGETNLPVFKKFYYQYR